MPSGSRLILVRIRSGMANASSRGRIDDPDLAVGVDLLVDPLLDLADQVAGHRLELEVHPARQRLHVAAGDRCPMVPPHDAAQDMQRGVGSHQPMAALPVDLGGDLGVDGRQLGAGLDGVPDVVVALLGADDAPRAAGLADQHARYRPAGHRRRDRRRCAPGGLRSRRRRPRPLMPRSGARTHRCSRCSRSPGEG